MKEKIKAATDKLYFITGSAEEELLDRRKDVGMLKVVKEHLISEGVAETVIKPSDDSVSHQVDGRKFSELLEKPLAEIESLLSSRKRSFSRMAEQFEPTYERMNEDRAANVRITMQEYRNGSGIPGRIEDTVGRTDLREKWNSAEKVEEVDDELVQVVEGYRELSDQDYGALLKLWEPNVSCEKIDEVMEEVKNNVISVLESLDDDEISKVWQKTSEGLEEDESLRKVSDKPARVHEFLVNYILGGNPVKMPIRIAENGMEYGNSSLAPLQTTEDHFWAKSLDTSAHEFGHTFGRQNLPEEHMFLPLGEPPSEAVDEGTARLYQNHVFRSKTFLKKMESHHSYWMTAHGIPDFDSETLHGWCNAIDPQNTERISASPLTYPLHVVIRYELEKELIESDEPVEKLVSELHAKWEEKMQSYIGDRIGVEYDLDEDETVLQDVHWGKGKLGYFSNYVLGDVMASLWKSRISDEAGKEFAEIVKENDLETINEWTVENIWSHGKAVWNRSDHAELNVDSYIDHLEEKADRLYG